MIKKEGRTFNGGKEDLISPSHTSLSEEQYKYQKAAIGHLCKTLFTQKNPYRSSISCMKPLQNSLT